MATALSIPAEFQRLMDGRSPDFKVQAVAQATRLRIGRDRLVDKGIMLPLVQCDAQKLPFADGSFDVVVCQFGAMFFPDNVGAYAEARRVLRRGGTLLFNVWDRIERAGVKGLYLMPNSHNPTGACVSAERRRALVAFSHDAGVPLIEDDACGDLGYAPGPRPPACKAW